MRLKPEVQATSSSANALPVVVIGAGPAGLAATARLLERGIEPLVLEAGERVGAHLLDHVHVQLISPWRHDIDPAIAKRLARTGWRAPPDDGLPLAREVVEQVLTRVFGGGTADALPARGQFGSALKALRDSGPLKLVSGLRIAAVRREDGRWTVARPEADPACCAVPAASRVATVAMPRPAARCC